MGGKIHRDGEQDVATAVDAESVDVGDAAFALFDLQQLDQVVALLEITVFVGDEQLEGPAAGKVEPVVVENHLVGNETGIRLRDILQGQCFDGTPPEVTNQNALVGQGSGQDQDVTGLQHGDVHHRPEAAVFPEAKNFHSVFVEDTHHFLVDQVNLVAIPVDGNPGPGGIDLSVEIGEFIEKTGLHLRGGRRGGHHQRHQQQSRQCDGKEIDPAMAQHSHGLGNLQRACHAAGFSETH